MLAKVMGFLENATAIEVKSSSFSVERAAAARGRNGSCGPSKVKAPSYPRSSSSLLAFEASAGSQVIIEQSILIFFILNYFYFRLSDYDGCIPFCVSRVVI